ncbi:MAG: prenyltransferase, partial [Aggregatilineales bacterium]
MTTTTETTDINTLPESKLSALIRLTRYAEHIPFTIPLTIGGGLLAVTMHDLTVDWRLFAVTAANILALAFAFMINDVEDAPDDALDPRKKAHNVISSGLISRREGYIACGLVVLAALALYLPGGTLAFISGVVTLVLCYLYSAHPFRLKARPLTDVISHALMLSGLLMLTGYLIYYPAPGEAWAVIIAVTLASAYGQFFNQVDDYEVDKAAGLKNTVVLLGKSLTTGLSYACVVGTVIGLGIAINQGLFPSWAGVIGLIGIFIALILPWSQDMRGNPVEGSGVIQRPVLMVANLVVLVW